MGADKPSPYDRVSQLRAVAVAVAVLLVVCGALLIGHRVAGCPHDHTRPVSTCLDLSTYSPYVAQGWLLILVGMATAALTFGATAVDRRRTRDRATASEPDRAFTQ